MKTHKLYLLFITCLFCIIASTAQQKEAVIDSLVVKKVDSLSNVFGALIGKDLDAAEAVVQDMLTYSTNHNYLKGEGMAYGSLGGLSSYRGNQGEAIAYFLKSADIFEAMGHDHYAAITYQNLGSLLIDQHQYEEAKVYVKKAHDQYILNQDGTTYGSLGLIDLETNKPLEQVMEHLKVGEALSIKNEDTLQIANFLRLQGYAYIKHNQDLPFAIARLNESIKLVNINSPNNHFGLGNSYLRLGEAHWKMGAYKQALVYNDSSLVHYEALDYYKGLRKTYDNRKEILASLGNYKDGFEAFRLYSKHNDSTFQKQRANQVARMKVEYETDQILAQKETAVATAALAQEKSERNKSFLIGAVIIAGLILLSSLLYFSRMKTQKNSEIVVLELRETQKRLALEKQYRDSELKALKAQMNPHFIFNALNSIQEYIILNKKNLAGDYLGKFADLMRRYLKHSDSGTLTIQDEIESLQMYLELEALRFEDTLQYSFNISEKINKEQLSIPTMLIQPYVENALKHGLLHRKTDRKLWIHFKQDHDATITCVIEDNGVGRDRAAAIKNQTKNLHVPFATKATENRLNLLNYQKDRKIGVEIIDLFADDGSAKGTRVVLSIPTITK